MSNVITYDIWVFTFVCLCTDNFVPKLVCLLGILLPAAFYNHSLPFECTYHALTMCHMYLYLTYGKSASVSALAMIIENIVCYSLFLGLWAIFLCFVYAS